MLLEMLLVLQRFLELHARLFLQFKKRFSVCANLLLPRLL
jgi:hypothetical protein